MGSVIDCPANDVWTDFGRGRELVMSTPTADEPCRVGFVKIWIYQNISVSFLLGLCTYNSSTLYESICLQPQRETPKASDSFSSLRSEVKPTAYSYQHLLACYQSTNSLGNFSISIINYQNSRNQALGALLFLAVLQWVDLKANY